MLTRFLSPFLRTGSIASEKEQKQIAGLLDMLLIIMPYPAYQIYPTELTRITRNAGIPGVGTSRINHLKHVIFPPEASVTKYGRCNVPNSSVFYSSFHFITNMKEVHIELGDIVTRSKWKLKNPSIPLNIFPIYFLTNMEDRPHNSLSLDLWVMHQNYVQELTEEEKECTDLVMEFLAKCFAKEADLNNDLDYYLSAYLSDKILSNPSANYDGILYPSVQDRLGTSNLALTQKAFLGNFEPTEVTHDFLISVKNGGAMFQGVHRSSKFDLAGGIKDGTIIWDD
jgi:hypothetical protein